MDLDQKLWGIMVMGVSSLIEWISLEAAASKKKTQKNPKNTLTCLCYIGNSVS